VLKDSTLPLRRDPVASQGQEDEDDCLMLGLILDFLTRQALTDPDGPVLYSEAMAAEDEDLLTGVIVDATPEA